MRKHLEIKEWQGDKVFDHTRYEYRGFDKVSGLHKFWNGEQIELFAKRKHPISGWQIVRGSYFYEYVRSAYNVD
jgi:hypothetical protein